MWDSHVTFFADCRSQVSLPPRLLIPSLSPREESSRFRASPRKTHRCPHLTVGLGLSTRPLDLTSWGKLQSKLQSLHVPSKGWGECLSCTAPLGSLMLCVPPFLAVAVCIPLLFLTLFQHTLTQSKIDMILITHHCSQTPVGLSIPSSDSALGASSPCYKRCPPVVLFHFQGRKYQTVLTREECLQPDLPADLSMWIPNVTKSFKSSRNTRAAVGQRRAQQWLQKSQGLPLYRNTSTWLSRVLTQRRSGKNQTPGSPSHTSRPLRPDPSTLRERRGCAEPPALSNRQSHHCGSGTNTYLLSPSCN